MAMNTESHRWLTQRQGWLSRCPREFAIPYLEARKASNGGLILCGDIVKHAVHPDGCAGDAGKRIDNMLMRDACSSASDAVKVIAEDMIKLRDARVVGYPAFLAVEEDFLTASSSCHPRRK